MNREKLKGKILLFKIRHDNNPDAFGELYDIYVPQIYRFIYFKVATREEADDLTSETFLRAWEYLQDKEQKIGNFTAFLYSVARNLVIDFYRGRARQEVLLGEEILGEIKDPRDITQGIQLTGEIKQLEKSLRLLKEEYREIIVLRYIEELGVGEIAEIIGKSKGATRVLIHRAIKTLREVMEGED